MDSTLDMLTNTSYKTLKKMYQCQVLLPDGSSFVPTSQSDLAKILQVNVMTMNKIFKQFIDEGLVAPLEGKRGKYALTIKARIIIEGIDGIEEEIKEVGKTEISLERTSK